MFMYVSGNWDIDVKHMRNIELQHHVLVVFWHAWWVTVNK